MAPRIIKISSENALFQHIDTLRRRREKRYKHREFFVEGVRPINQALAYHWPITAFIYARGRRLSDWARGILAAAPAAAAGSAQRRRAASGVYVVDTGFEGQHWHLRWAHCYGATVIAKPKRSAPGYWPQPLRRWHASIRQIVETVHDRLLETFGLEHERPHALAGFRARLAAKGALHNFCLWLNVQLGRPPLAFADLIDW